MQFTLLEQEINGHMEKIDIVVIDLNSIDIFLRYDWLVKYNPEVNWNKGVRTTGQKSKAYQISRKSKVYCLRNTELYTHLQKILREQNRNF